MNRRPIRSVLALLLPFIFTAILATQAFAVDNVVETTFFGNMKDDGQGCGVFTILNSVVDIFSIGVGILAVIGIAIAGTKYLTAKGNIDQTKKAKRRILEIVIGLAAYVLLYAGVQWLLPGGKLNTNQQCTTISDAELAALKAEEQAKTNSASSTSTNSSSTNNSSSSSNTNPNQACVNNLAKAIKDTKVCEAKTAAELIARTAAYLAWPMGTSSKTYSQKPTPAFKAAIDETMTFPKSQQQYKWTKGRSCSVFVTAVVRASGYDKKFANTGNKYSVASINSSAKNSNKWQKVSPSEAVRGDIFAYKDNHHVMIYGGKVGSKYLWYQADLGDYYGYTSYGGSPTSKKNVNVWHATGK